MALLLALATHPDAQRLVVGAFSARMLEHAHDIREETQRARGQAGPVDLLTQAAKRNTAARKETKRTRVAADGVLIGNYMSTLERVYPASPAEHMKMEAFYENVGDGFDEEISFGGAPENYPMFHALHEHFYKEFEARDKGLDSVLSDVPRPPELPVRSRQDLRVFRMPPVAGGRCCRLAEACAFKRKFPHDSSRSYAGREFFLGAHPPPSDTPLGLCYDDILIEYKRQFFLNVEQGYTPPRPINAFTVAVGGSDQYAPDCLLPTEVEGRITGIAGAVPSYDVKQREYKEVPEEDMRRYGLPVPEPDQPALYYLAEINVTPLATVRPWPTAV